MQASNKQQNESQFYRFKVFQGVEEGGQVKRTKSVGMAYLRDGQQTITMRLWMFVEERFYLILNDKDASKYLVMTREPNKNPNAKNKYFWNIVGNGMIDSARGIVRIEFDLFDKKIYMNLHPEVSASSASLAEPDFVTDAA